MKNLNLLVLAFLLFATAAQAQFGIKAGVNGSAAGSYGNSEEGESAAAKIGFQAGVFYKLPILEKLNIMVELNYEARGTVSKKDYVLEAFPVVPDPTMPPVGFGDYAIKQEANSRQNYINVPVLAMFGGDRFKLYVGPNFGYLVSTNATFDRTIDLTFGGQTVQATAPLALEDVDWKDYDSFKDIFRGTPPAEDGDFLESVEVGLNVGAMFNVTEKLFLDLRINQGLSDSTNDSYDNSIYAEGAAFTFPSRDDTDRNFSVQLSVGMAF